MTPRAGARARLRVHVRKEHQFTGERKHAISGSLITVALDAAGNPTPVPRLIVETEDTRAEFEVAAHVHVVAIRRSNERCGRTSAPLMAHGAWLIAEGAE